ncbi:MAG: S1/P1 Nuclease [Bacteroidetes bacterium]|nr:MAG: S1/P1 Nuclease [Bacteroidota bacterium]
MKVTRCFSLITVLFIASSVFAWGKTGHRVVGYVAQQHLTKKASKQIDKILTSYSLEMSGNYLDFIRADTNYRFMNSWHYVSIPDGKRYEDITPNSRGDVIAKIEELILELKTKDFKIVKDEEFALMALVHLVGDLHQPLHVGLAEDRGGNSIKVQWFGKETNLHHVWDSEIIDDQQLSYTEFGNHINRGIDKSLVKVWQSTSVRDWAHESQDLRGACYDFGKFTNLRYRYTFRHLKTVETRLEQAGVRLAGLLNDIYG